tara:strand:+ start:34 stop:222 length:189 start_codon:yes stop_codon:yes gene_type:complete
MAIRIDIKTDDKSEAESAFQLVSFLNQLDVRGEIHAIWADPQPMSITIDWSGRVETIKDHVE